MHGQQNIYIYIYIKTPISGLKCSVHYPSQCCARKRRINSCVMGFKITHHLFRVTFLSLFIFPAVLVTFRIITDLTDAGNATSGNLAVYRYIKNEGVIFQC